MRFLSSLLLLLGVAGTLFASDLSRERRIADEIVDAVVVGDARWLKAGDIEFLAIHTEAQTAVREGGVILLHGWGAHPDWLDVVQPLRSVLPDSGWETLSLQMPVAALDASDEAYTMLIPEAFPRISAGVEFLKQRGITNIVLVGHSFGARMGVEYLAEEPGEEIKAFVAVGFVVRRPSTDPGSLDAIASLKLPVLDIYGSRDLEAVTGTANERAAAARRAGNEGYQQLEVPGADHYFRGVDDTLTARIRAWMRRFSQPLDNQGEV